MWLHTFGLTIAFFLISIGFGLFILAMASKALLEASGLSRLQLIVLGFMIGGPGTGIFLQLFSLVSTNLNLSLGILSCISLIGILATKNLWRPYREDRHELLLWVAISVPLALITWWWSFGAFSSFPFGDVGADVHWMKIAQEYADTGIINPYADQSYIDLRSGLAGALSGTLSLDLLQFNWVYRYFSILFIMVTFYIAADAIFIDPHRKWLAFFLSAAGNALALGLLTNGGTTVVGSVVFLAILLRKSAGHEQQDISYASTLLPVGAVLFGILLAFALNNNSLMLASLLAIVLLFNVINRAKYVPKSISGQAFARVIWSTALMSVHRGSYLFVPIVIAAWLFYFVVSKTITAAKPGWLKFWWAISIALPVLSVCILIIIFVGRLGYLPTLNGNESFSYITLLILGRAIREGDELALGAGPDVAAIEIGRTIGPFFAIGIGIIFVWWWNTNRPEKLRQTAGNPQRSENVARLLWSWIAACGLCIAVLSGFPFLYRILFIILALFSISATELFSQLLIDPLPDPVERRRFVAGIAATMVVFLVVGLYAFSWSATFSYSGYQAMVRTSMLTAAAVVLLCPIITFARSRQMQIAGLAAALGIGVAIDHAGLTALFRVYSYGQPPDKVTIVSHYDASDLGADHWLHDNLRNSLVISDPYTLGMAQAIAGIPGLYLFSNLDTVNEITADRAKAVISTMLHPAGDTANSALGTCKAVLPFLTNLNQEALAQIRGSDLTHVLLRPIRPEKLSPEKKTEDTTPPKNAEDISHAMEALETSRSKWNLVAIINPRTVQWLRLNSGQRLSYFPTDRPLEQETLNRLHESPFRLLFSDNQNVVISIDCRRM